MLDSDEFEELEVTIGGGNNVMRQTEKTKNLTSADHYQKNITK
jgi:hypothetical protein